MPLSSKTIARVAPQTAHPLTVAPLLRFMPRSRAWAERVSIGDSVGAEGRTRQRRV